MTPRSDDPSPPGRRISARWIATALLMPSLCGLVGLPALANVPSTTVVSPEPEAEELPATDTEEVAGTERAILAVEVNGEPVGEMFVCLAGETGDVYLEQSDYASLGLGFGATEGLVRINNAPFVSLDSLQPRLQFKINQADLSLRITARPEVPGVRWVSGYNGPTGATFLEGSSVFFNYDLEFYRPPQGGATSSVLAHELGFRKGRVLALGSFAWRREDGLSEYQRLQTQVIVDYRQSMRRLVALDSVASAGPMGSTIPLFGATLAKEFSIDPYFIRFPMPDLAGSVSTASDIEVYQNGFLRDRFHVPPGQFRIEDLPVSAIGVGSYDVVIRDAFGRETSLSESFYLSRGLLREGLHAYNYGVGLQRESTLGGEPEYGDPALIGEHRYGYRDWLTVGANFEASPEVAAAGLTADFRLGLFGVVNVGTALGGGPGGGGPAAYLAYNYNSSRYATNVFLRSFSDGYTNLQRERSIDPVQFEALTRFSFRASRFTSLSLTAARTDTVHGAATRRAGLTLTQRLRPESNLVATYERQAARVPDALSTDDDIFFVGLQFFLPSRISVDVRHSSDTTSSRQAVTVRRNVPLQEGYGYRITLERLGLDGLDDEIRPSGYVVRNGPLGVYRAEYVQVEGSPTWRVGAAGSLALVEGALFVSRPLHQSFAVVRTSNLKGVRVSSNGEPVGRTRRGGKILVPNLRAYEVNKLSIDGEDLPLDYNVETLEQQIIPVPRSGAVVDFEVQRLRAVFGRLFVDRDGKPVPLEHGELFINGLPRNLSWRSGIDGEFYLENLPEGSYEMHVRIGEQQYRCWLLIPLTGDSLTDVGEVPCVPLP